jgi:hypothetical protein
MSHCSFDGPNKIIQIIEPPVGGYLDIGIPADVYEEWKEWMMVADNSKYLQAMYSLGGEPLPGGLKLGSTFFLINDWKIRPYEETHTLRVTGNLFCDDGTSPFIPTTGYYNVQVIMSVSNLTTAVETGVSGLTSEESAQLAAIDVVSTKSDGLSADLGSKLTKGQFLALK